MNLLVWNSSLEWRCLKLSPDDNSKRKAHILNTNLPSCCCLHFAFVINFSVYLFKHLVLIALSSACYFVNVLRCILLHVCLSNRKPHTHTYTQRHTHSNSIRRRCVFINHWQWRRCHLINVVCFVYPLQNVQYLYNEEKTALSIQHNTQATLTRIFLGREIDAHLMMSRDSVL